jgi:hypothetical protein
VTLPVLSVKVQIQFRSSQFTFTDSAPVLRQLQHNVPDRRGRADLKQQSTANLGDTSGESHPTLPAPLSGRPSELSFDGNLPLFARILPICH